jgi:hypothetical protein
MNALIRCLPIAAAAALLLAPPALAAEGFSLGVAAGEVSSSSAVLWAHATKSGSYTLQVAAKKNFKKRACEISVKATSGNDNTVQAKAGKLKPGRRYYYRFVGKRRRRSDTGTFRTAPKASANATFKFGWTASDHHGHSHRKHDEDPELQRPSADCVNEQVGDADAQHHTPDQLDRALATLPVGGADADHGGDRGEDGLGLRQQQLREIPGRDRRDRGLQNRPHASAQPEQGGGGGGHLSNIATQCWA